MKIGPWEIILILIIITMIFGAGKLPEIGKQIGRGVRDFKKYSSSAEESNKDPKPETAQQAKAPQLVDQNTFNKN